MENCELGVLTTLRFFSFRATSGVEKSCSNENVRILTAIAKNKERMS